MTKAKLEKDIEQKQAENEAAAKELSRNEKLLAQESET